MPSQRDCDCPVTNSGAAEPHDDSDFEFLKLLELRNIVYGHSCPKTSDWIHLSANGSGGIAQLTQGCEGSEHDKRDHPHVAGEDLHSPREEELYYSGDYTLRVRGELTATDSPTQSATYHQGWVYIDRMVLNHVTVNAESRSHTSRKY